MIGLQAQSISKSFAGIRAVDGVNISLVPGRCHGLVGENGAGKSTLGKILAGLVSLDTGNISLDGETVNFRSPRDAAKAGIAMVHQEVLFCENLSVAENLALGSPPARGWFYDAPEARERAATWLKAIGSSVDPSATIGELAPAQQQQVQIAGALGLGARILIFDEPTSSLPLPDAKRLLTTIRQLVADGLSCVYISHRLDEIIEVCDDVTVMRDGKIVTQAPLGEFDRRKLISAMVGREIQATEGRANLRNDAEPIIVVEGLSSQGKLKCIDLTVRRGEIVGLAGLVGAGRTELLEALFGLDRVATGDGRTGTTTGIPLSPADAMDRGISLVPEDRKRLGLVLSMTATTNATLTVLDRVSTAGFIQSKRELRLASELFDKMSVRTRDDQAAATLSGGNQQKVLLAKWLATDCKILLVDEPTRGVDIAARAEIHRILIEQAAQGKTIVLASSDLPELLELSHRIVVLRDGAIVGELDGRSATEESVLSLMSGLVTA